MSNGVATELQKQFYNSWAAMVQDMRDYKTHGAWFKEAMRPILPMKAWKSIPYQENLPSSKWEAEGYGWEAPDFYPHIVTRLLFYSVISIPLDIMRGKRVSELRELVAPHKVRLASFSAYFSLEKELAKDFYNMSLFVDRESYANRLFAEAIGRSNECDTRLPQCGCLQR